MKILLVVPMFVFVTAAWASDDCKNQAQTAVEIREDYKNFTELQADVYVMEARAEGLTGERYAIEMGRLQQLPLIGQLVFFHSSGAKGVKLYNKTYNSCIADEKVAADRAARREAREAARAAKGVK